ncbi:MAG TPA: molybdopterin molybdenumtransferase MoeA, partial [Candidatus Wirthbacteria bacterium]|nr:molybdopterin molybdenumtransferase MoeA [Candidatus Wirthbacteria bacterium]
MEAAVGMIWRQPNSYKGKQMNKARKKVKPGQEMISFEQACQLIWQHSSTLGSETILTRQAVGRVLAEAIKSPLALPPFAKSAMDGYAVRLSGKEKYPLQLEVVGIAPAGISQPGFKLAAGQACKIMTGAALPKGANTVVRIEDVKTEGKTITVKQTLTKGMNVCARGEDVKQGALVLPLGQFLRPVEIGILASLGISKVKVYRQPTIALLSTGDELVNPSVEPLPGQIRDTNRPLLLSYLTQRGLVCQDLGIAKDNQRSISEKIAKGLKADILLISGGVSMGDYDLVPQVLSSSGVQQVFHKVQVKPGKPLFFGKTDSTLVFGLPGNPVSSLLGAR